MVTRITTQPTSEPVDVTFMRNYLHWIDTDSSTEEILKDYIKAARELFEKVLNVSLAEKTYEVSFYPDEIVDGFFELPFFPQSSIKKVSKLDNGSETEVTDYSFDDYTGQIRVKLDSGINGFYKISFEAGYVDIPAILKMALCEQVGNWYEGETEMGELSKATLAKIQSYSHNLM